LTTDGVGLWHWATGDWKEVRRFEVRAERYDRLSYLLSPSGRYVLNSSEQQLHDLVLGAAGTFSADGEFWVRLETSRTEKRSARVEVRDRDAGGGREIRLDAPEESGFTPSKPQDAGQREFDLPDSPVIAASPGAKGIAVISRRFLRDDNARLDLYDLA